MAPTRFFSMLLVGAAWTAGAFGAVPARVEVELVMFAVPESHWREGFEGPSHEHPALWQRLKAGADAGRVQVPMNFKFLLADGDAVVQRKGTEEEFVETWETWPDGTKAPLRKTKRFIGTSVEIAEEARSDGTPLRVRLDLQHDIAPPLLQKMNYANAAVGEERERLSVAYPKFEKLQWRGRLHVTSEWRLVANVLHSPVMGVKPSPPTRYLVFIKRA